MDIRDRMVEVRMRLRIALRTLTRVCITCRCCACSTGCAFTVSPAVMRAGVAVMMRRCGSRCSGRPSRRRISWRIGWHIRRHIRRHVCRCIGWRIGWHIRRHIRRRVCRCIGWCMGRHLHLIQVFPTSSSIRCRGATASDVRIKSATIVTGASVAHSPRRRDAEAFAPAKALALRSTVSHSVYLLWQTGALIGCFTTAVTPT